MYIYPIKQTKTNNMKTFLITYKDENNEWNTIEDISSKMSYSKADFIENFTDCTFISICEA